MRLFALALVALLTACNDDTPKLAAQVSAPQIVVATELCEPNGGLYWVRRTYSCESRGCTRKYWTEATCKNGAVFKKPADNIILEPR